ncbi:MAG TPA: hypothetical protein PKY82_00745 [Pyrinomonadaceae bacterium]|nr:hypothetical protein [Pyrinomonadaceae bacterium]
MKKTELENFYGEVLSTAEAVEKYEFIAFCAPFVEVRRRADGCLGTLEFQPSPRFYFAFIEDLSAKSQIQNI